MVNLRDWVVRCVCRSSSETPLIIQGISHDIYCIAYLIMRPRWLHSPMENLNSFIPSLQLTTRHHAHWHSTSRSFPDPEKSEDNFASVQSKPGSYVLLREMTPRVLLAKEIQINSHLTALTAVAISKAHPLSYDSTTTTPSIGRIQQW